MKIRVLGNYGGISLDTHLSSFLINDSLLLETGAAASALSLEEQKKIKDILVTHYHLDSIFGICFIADNLACVNSSVNVYCIKEVLETIKKHILNNEIWPDFTKIPSPENPTLRLKEITEGEVINVSRMEVIPVRVEHTVAAVGYILRDNKGAVVFSGESSPTNRIWDYAKREKRLKAIIIESAFPDSQEELARRSGHLIPKDLPRELEKLGNPNIPVLLHNFKPEYVEEIKKDVLKLEIKNIDFIEKDKIYEF
ncbi:MAG TPA: 3',5'-cyclic-nucleotide phosphodiesterase [Nitrospinota bacterium]|nr:3',5'-cyclic-nucleotide phosphodiesterase [Nitrospinota bacterium]